MTIPANFPLQIRVGDTESISLRIEDENGTAIDIAGRTYASQIRSSADASTVIASFNCAVVGNGSTGQVTCTLPASTTSALSPGMAVFDLQETNGTVVTTLLAGQVSIVQDVTRS
jgi:hypothetical protein